MPRLQENRFKSRGDESGMQALGEWSRLDADEGQRQAQVLEGLDERLGWVSTLLSFTTLPVASTMHTLDSSKETSIPA